MGDLRNWRALAELLLQCGCHIYQHCLWRICRALIGARTGRVTAHEREVQTASYDFDLRGQKRSKFFEIQPVSTKQSLCLLI